MELNDSNAAQKVIGTLLINNELIEDDQFPLDVDYFYTRLDTICFSSIYNIYQNGIRDIDVSHVTQYLEKYQDQFDYFNLQNGEEYLRHCKKIAEEINYQYYYERIKKFAILRSFEINGFDISPIYNIHELNQQRLEAMTERFDNAKPEEIITYFEKITNNIDIKFQTSNGLKGGHASEGLDNYYDSLKDSPELGLGLNGNLLNTITRGARLRKLYIRSSGTGVGKAIPNDTIIPTFDKGFKRVDEINIGDLLIDRYGNPTKVLKIYPQPKKKQVYRITFADGRVAKCCKDHLWTYQYYNGEEYKEQTSSVKEMLEYSKKYKKKYQNNKGSYIFRIVVNDSINYTTKILPVDPYMLGLCLGNKNFKFNENINLFNKKFLNRYSELINANIEDRYIPFEYQLADKEQRMKLFTGLLSTDGVIISKDSIKINIISKQLAEDIVLLSRSLGFLTNIDINYSQKNNDDTYYLISIKNKEYTNFIEYNPIINIEALEDFVDMTCFTVDNDEGLFLMNDYIVTHNTRTLVGSASQLGVGTYYDIFKKTWIKANEPQSCLYITSEQELEEIQTIILAFVSGVDEEKILNRTESDEESERIKKALELIKKSKLYVEPIGDYGIRQLINLIKKHKYSNNIRYVFHDYIHSSLTLLNEISSSAKIANIRDDQILLMLTNALKNACNQLNLFMFSATQLNRSYKTEDKPDATVIRGALSISDKADYCSIMMNIEKDELDLLKTLFDFNQMPIKPNVITHIFKNRRNKYVDMKLYSYLDKATGQMLDLFALNYNNEVVEIKSIQIVQK